MTNAPMSSIIRLMGMALMDSLTLFAPTAYMRIAPTKGTIHWGMPILL